MLRCVTPERPRWAAILQVLLLGALIPLAEGAEPEYRTGDAVPGGTSRIETRDIPATDSNSGQNSKAPPALTYVTLNLLHGGFLSGLSGRDEHLEQRLGLVIRELRTIAPDVVGLQEASASRERGNVAARLAAELGLQYVYAPALFHLFDSQALNDHIASVMNFTEGPAILSRFPITRWTAHRLPSCGHLTDPRVLLFAELETPWGRVGVFSTHISDDPCQSQAVATLVRDSRGPLPTILMGDFNAEENSPVITALTREGGLVDVFRMANPTAPGATVWRGARTSESTARRRVDYLFLLPGTAFTGRVLSSWVVADRLGRLPDGTSLRASDHSPVLATIEVFPTSPASVADLSGDTPATVVSGAARSQENSTGSARQSR
jgi:endonuclease/exonuclease/phosphatase family metal-dependent hydrolase